MKGQRLTKRIICFLFFISKSFSAGMIQFSPSKVFITLPSLSSQFQIPLSEIIKSDDNPSLIYFRNEYAQKIYISLVKNFHLNTPVDYIFALDSFSLKYNPDDFRINIIESSEIACYMIKGERQDDFHCSSIIRGNYIEAAKVNFPRPRMGVSNNTTPVIDYLELSYPDGF